MTESGDEPIFSRFIRTVSVHVEVTNPISNRWNQALGIASSTPKPCVYVQEKVLDI